MTDEARRKATLAKRDALLNGALEKLGISSFRPVQKSVIKNVMRKKDVLAVLPTGHGKSLCYQVPAVLLPGVTIVVSPLIALITDQVNALLSKNVQAATLNSSQNAAAQKEILEDLNCDSPTTKVLFLTPERIASNDKCLSRLHSRGLLSLVAIDEAHCIVQWGSTFRKDYLKLHVLRDAFPQVPILALTATATKAVQNEIVQSLRFNKESYKTFIISSNRPNLKYVVRYKDLLSTQHASDKPIELDLCKWIVEAARISGDTSIEKKNKVRKGSGLGAMLTAKKPKLTTSTQSNMQRAFLGNFDPATCPCSIIYCHKREDTESVAAFLKRINISAAAYHGGMSNSTREHVQTMWQKGDIKVCCATIAFGMGIDKANVRLVVHWKMPVSMSGYFQQCGRAGRDGKPSLCVIYYSRDDFDNFRFLNSSSSSQQSTTSEQQATASSSQSAETWLKVKSASDQDSADGKQQTQLHELSDVSKYCESSKCRRRTMLKFFGEEYDEHHAENCCDVCDDPETALLLAKQLAQLIKLQATTKGSRADRREKVASAVHMLKKDNTYASTTQVSQKKLRGINLIDFATESHGLVNASSQNSHNGGVGPARKRKSHETESEFLDRLEFLETKATQKKQQSKRQLLMAKLNM